MCAMGLEQKLKHMRGEETQASTTVAFRAYGRTLDMVKAFNYIGWVLKAFDGN